jgi:hypothetical protein
MSAGATSLAGAAGDALVEAASLAGAAEDASAGAELAGALSVGAASFNDGELWLPVCTGEEEEESWLPVCTGPEGAGGGGAPSSARAGTAEKALASANIAMIIAYKPTRMRPFI